MKITNVTKNTVIAENADVASTLWTRIKGLLGRTSLTPGEALIITKCRSIHMLFMKFAIDAIFVDRHHRVVHVTGNIRPFQLSAYVPRADFVIECAPGTIGTTKTALGDQLELSGSVS